MSFLDNVLRKMKLSDNRKAPRLDSPTLVAYYWDGATPTAHEIQNISYDGFYMLTDDRLRPGTVVTMTLQRSSDTNVESSSQPHLTVMSIVVREGPDGIGFAFVPQESKDAERSQNARNRPADRRAIRKFIEQVHSDGFLTFTSIANRSRTVTRKLADEDGQTLIFAALCMTCLFGFVALAADVGIMMRQKRMAQTAADAAAIAGALADFKLRNTGLVQRRAKAASAQNGFTNGSGGVTVTVNPPPFVSALTPKSDRLCRSDCFYPTADPLHGPLRDLQYDPYRQGGGDYGGGAGTGCVYALSPTWAEPWSCRGIRLSYRAELWRGCRLDRPTAPCPSQEKAAAYQAGSVGVVGPARDNVSDKPPTERRSTGIIPQAILLVISRRRLPHRELFMCCAQAVRHTRPARECYSGVCQRETSLLTRCNSERRNLQSFTGPTVNLGGTVTTMAAEQLWI